MGTALKDIILYKEIEISDLQHKILVVDAHNLLYQFLTTIRSRDGSPLLDSKGNTTSHLVGLFSRSTKLIQIGLKLAFVFDGVPPKLKQKERERRKELKLGAQRQYEQAKAANNIEMMKKYASRSTHLTAEIINESKELIKALGLPLIEAPSEGEAQAAYMTNQGKVYAAVSQDFDSLLHGAQKLVRNLSIGGKRKIPNKLHYETIKPELITLSESLKHISITNDQLIVLAILVGTDYNIGGVKGIGPKNALKLVKKHKNDFGAVFTEAKWKDHFDFPWAEVYDTIKNMPVTDKYQLKWSPIKQEKLRTMLIDKHDFSLERVNSTLLKISKEEKEKSQKGIKDFI